MSTRRHAPCGAGFTLIEVLVALVIVAFGMGAVLSALSSSADNVIRMREKTYAEWIGLNQLATERLQATVPATATKEGDVDFGGTRWHWQETVENMEVPGVRRLTIRVRHTESSTAQTRAAKAAVDKNSWVTTVVGFRGDAMQSPLDMLPDWDGGGAAAAPGQPGN